MQQKLKVVVQSRNDAIGKYSKELIDELGKICHVEVVNFYQNEKDGVLRNLFRYLIDFLLLIFKSSSRDKYLFVDPASIQANAVFFLKGRKFILLHHLDKEPLYYKILPFMNMKVLLNKFDGIICDSKFSQRQLKKLGVSTNNIVVYGGVNKNIFNIKSKVCNSFVLPKNYILSVGTELPRKNVYGIIKAFYILKKDFPDLKLVKVGVVDKVDRKRTLSLIKKFNLTDDVIFLNYITEEDLVACYRHARLFLFPSFLEGFGMPLLEAMACGCPVVTSDRDPMKELVGNGGILVDPENIDDIVRGCISILGDRNIRSKAILYGRERLRLFCWTKTALKIKDYVL